MSLEKYLLDFEKKSGLLSVIKLEKVSDYDKVIKYFDDNLDFIYGSSEMKGNILFWNEKIFKTKQDFIVYLYNDGLEWGWKVYFLPKKLSELQLFIKSVFKNLKK